MILAALADDWTGANDLAGRVAAWGHRTYSALAPSPALAGRSTQSGPDERHVPAEALVWSIETRMLDPVGARRASRRAWNRLSARHGSRIWYQKMDSTLRGNPGEEILGMLEALDAPRIAFCPAYPAQGRVTRHGAHFVNGRRLDQSEFFHDPLSPARTYRPVQLFPAGLAVEVRPGGLQQALRSGARVLCFDATRDADLRRIAKDCLRAGIRHFAGASGLAAELARHYSIRPSRMPRKLPPRRIALAGSVSERNFAQLEALRASAIGTWVSLDQPLPMRERWDRLALSTLRRRADLKPGRQAAERALQRLIRRGLAVAGRPERAFWFLTGGHTAHTFFRELGVTGAWVLGELMPGVPLCRAQLPDGSRFWYASKPGGFGDVETLVRIMSWSSGRA